ncbi:MAG: chloride channel protein, partial [Myxococcales bacterium]|nr:chloride channel protein [Myxococcales bacterium]
MNPTEPLVRDRKAWQQGQMFMVGVAVLVGLAGALGAVLFRLLIRIFQGLFFGGVEGVQAVFAQGLLAEPVDPVETARALSWQWKIAIPALGGLVVGPLIHFFAREAKGHGVPEVMVAVALRGGVIRKRVATVKTLASAISIGAGGSVGREGPIVQIGSPLGSTIGQWLRVSPRQLRTIVACGAASGVAATFNAPIAGAIFAVEVIAGDFALASFSPVVIASVVATVASRFLLGNHPTFKVPDFELVSPFELLPYMLVGALAALVGLAFSSTLHKSEDLFERLPIPDYTKAMVGGALVGVIALSFPEVYGVGYGAITDALAGSIPTLTLGALLIAKMLATSISIGGGMSGGVFAPSLFLGAMTGGFFGGIIHQWFPDATAGSGAYALVTMGAVVSATTHAPITAILILFELTQSITIIPPLMAACVVATGVATFLRKDSIYTSKLSRRGIDLKQERDTNVLRTLHVRDVMDRDPDVVPASASFPEVLDLVVQSRHTEFFVVDAENRLLGAMNLSELRRLIFERDTLHHVVVAADLVEAHPTVPEDDTLDHVMHVLGHGDLDEIAVVDATDPRKIVGTINYQHILDAYNEELMRRDMAGEVSSTVSVLHKVTQVELGGGFVVQQVQAPHSFCGRSLRDLNVR